MYSHAMDVWIADSGICSDYCRCLLLHFCWCNTALVLMYLWHPLSLLNTGQGSCSFSLVEFAPSDLVHFLFVGTPLRCLNVQRQIGFFSKTVCEHGSLMCVKLLRLSHAWYPEEIGKHGRFVNMPSAHSRMLNLSLSLSLSLSLCVCVCTDTHTHTYKYVNIHTLSHTWHAYVPSANSRVLNLRSQIERPNFSCCVSISTLWQKALNL